MYKKAGNDSGELSSETIVDGQHVTTKSPKRFKKLRSFRYGKQVLVVALFALVGVVGVFIASAATTTSSLWSASEVPKTIADPDTKSVELGVKFQSKYAGKVTGVKFYKSAQNTGQHTGTLWDTEGNKLATVTFKNETASGWQTASFPQPVNIAANVNYIISYHAPNGRYSSNDYYFNQARVNGPLTAPKNEAGKPNGVYAYSNSVTFPQETYQASNYWVDVVFTTNLINPPVTSAPPTQVTAVAEGNAVRVSWNKGTSSGPITKYRIYKNNVGLRAVGGNQLSYLDTDVVPGRTYTYQIKTVDEFGVGSVRSVRASVAFNVTPPPACPVGQTGTPPNCVAPPATCPAGQTGTPPNCVAPPVSGTVPCPLTAEAEACWRANTGVPGYTQAQIVAGQSNLKKVTSQATAPAGTTYNNGRLTITANNTVIDRMWLDGCIAVKASNVTISNSLIRSTISCNGGLDSGGPNAIISTGVNGGGGLKNFVIHHSEIDGMNTPGDTMAIGQTEWYGHHLNIQGTAKGGKADQNVRLEESYLHNVMYDGSTHTENFFYNGGAGNVIIKHNWMKANDQFSTGALSFNNDWSGKNSLVDSNYLEGGGGYGFTGGCYKFKPAPCFYNTIVSNNAFSPNNGYGFATAFDANLTGNSWVNNYNAVTKVQIGSPGPANN